MNTVTDAEREIAASTAKRAMISGWTKAIKDTADEYKIPPGQVTSILDRTAKENPNRDPSSRIDELADWEHEKMRNSEVKRSPFAKLSPGLKAYMEHKSLKASKG